MNVVLTVIFALQIATTIIQTEAITNWSWKRQQKRWSPHYFETHHSCAVGHCVKLWNCPKTAIAVTREENSCMHREYGPWVCCLENDDRSYRWEGANIYTSETSFSQVTTREPLSSDSSNGNSEEISRFRPLGDILINHRDKYPISISRNKTITTKVPKINITSNIQSNNRLTSNIIYKRTTNLWDKPTISTSSPNYIKRTTNLRDNSTLSHNYHKTTNLYDKPRTSDSRIIFPTERVTKYPTSSRPTKRVSNNESAKKSSTESTSSKAFWGYTTSYTRRTISTTTKRPYSKKPTVLTKASTRRYQSSTAYPAKSQATTRPTYIRSATQSTKRYIITTPLPNVNIHLCGIRDERRTIPRQTRNDNNRYKPVNGAFYPGSIRSRNRFQFQRIVGGEEVEPFSWPWVAALYKVTSSGGNRFLSAGSLINENFILTAAHLFTPEDLRTSSYVAMLGTHDAQDSVAQYSVSSVLLHPNYEHRYYYNDIALLKLERKVLFNNYIMPVCLPSPNAPLISDKDLLGRNVTVMGWGDDSFGGKSSQVLMKATFPIVSRASCNASYIRVASNRFPRGITADMLCAGDPKGGKDACQGDSGGPLTVIENRRHTQVGIVSFGYKCGDKEFPGVYTKVAPYLNWIADNTKYADDALDYEYY